MPHYKDFEGYPGNSSIVKEIVFPAFRSAIEVSRVLKYGFYHRIRRPLLQYHSSINKLFYLLKEIIIQFFRAKFNNCVHKISFIKFKFSIINVD
jgi:hypothetical protein